MTLAPFVRIVAQGKGRARPLSMSEADKAMSVILSGQAEPEAVGAILMVLRLRGETDAEIAGFTAALRRASPQTLPATDLDWPCYAAGRTRGAPLFLLAARLVADAGFCVFMHGWSSQQGSAYDLPHAIERLGFAGGGLHYISLDALNPTALALLSLRDTFGLRSCINTVLRMWNPSHAPASVQGVFHPSYRGLQSRAAALLGDQNLTVIKGGGGEFERNPAKEIALFGVRDGTAFKGRACALLDETRRLHETDAGVELAKLWDGTQSDPFVTATVTGTAALALWSLGAAENISDCEAMSDQLWAGRHATERKIA